MRAGTVVISTFVSMNLVAAVLSFRHWVKPYTKPLSMQSNSFKAIWAARVCFVLNALCFLGVLVLIAGGVLQGLSQDDSFMVAMVLYTFGLMGLVPYWLSMMLLWSLFLGKRFNVSLRMILLGMGLYIIALASAYELLIGIAL